MVFGRPASLHRVLAGRVPLLRSQPDRLGRFGTIRALRLPAVPSAALRFLRLAVPRRRLSFWSHGRQAPIDREPGPVFSRWPNARDHRAETAGSPAFLGNPVAPMPCSTTPAGGHASGRTMRPRGPRAVHDEGSRIWSFEAQSHGLGTRCLRFAEGVASPRRKTRFRLLTSSTGRARPVGFHRKVSDMHHPPFPSIAAQGQPPISA